MNELNTKCQLSGADKTYNLEQAQARLMHFQAELAELQTRQFRESLMTREDLENILVSVYAQIRAQLLALPSENSPKLYRAQNEADHYVLLTVAIYELRDAMPLCRYRGGTVVRYSFLLANPCLPNQL